MAYFADKESKPEPENYSQWLTKHQARGNQAHAAAPLANPNPNLSSSRTISSSPTNQVQPAAPLANPNPNRNASSIQNIDTSSANTAIAPSSRTTNLADPSSINLGLATPPNTQLNEPPASISRNTTFIPPITTHTLPLGNITAEAAPKSIPQVTVRQRRETCRPSRIESPGPEDRPSNIESPGPEDRLSNIDSPGSENHWTESQTQPPTRPPLQTNATPQARRPNASSNGGAADKSRRPQGRSRQLKRPAHLEDSESEIEPRRARQRLGAKRQSSRINKENDQDRLEESDSTLEGESPKRQRATVHPTAGTGPQQPRSSRLSFRPALNPDDGSSIRSMSYRPPSSQQSFISRHTSIAPSISVTSVSSVDCRSPAYAYYNSVTFYA